MERTNFIIDLNTLNEEAKREIIDFYEYLLYKYRIKQTSYKKSKLQKFIANPILVNAPYTFNRSELYDR